MMALALALDAVTSFSVVPLRLICALGVLVFAVIMRLMTREGVHYLVAQACATAVVLFGNFIGNSVWTFGGSSVEERERV